MPEINRVVMSSVGLRRICSLSKANGYRGINVFESNRIDQNNKKYINNNYSEKIKKINNLLQSNIVQITDRDDENKISEGVEVLSIFIDEDKKLKDKVINLKVLQLAKLQINSSVQLVSNSKNIKPGDYEFQISIKEKKFIGKVQIKEDENNEDVLRKVSSSINLLNCGIKSRVVKGKIGVVTLYLNSNEMGVSGGFKIKDFRSDIISKLELDYVRQAAQNTECVIDNKIYESDINEISIEGSLIKLKINSKGNYNIDINKTRCYEAIQANSEEIATNLVFFTNYYNNKIEYTPKNTFIHDKLIEEFRGRESLFNNVGIEELKNHRMKFKEENFKYLARRNPEDLMLSMVSSKGVLNFFNMIKSSDLYKQSSTYGLGGKNFAVYLRKYI